ncbi:MAG: TlpA family protein disulfide reductase, partial [Chloroflexota bacterium]
MAKDVPAPPRVSRRALYAGAAGMGACGLALVGVGIYEGFFAGQLPPDTGGISGGPLVGQPAPTFAVVGLSGEPVSLTGFQGKILLLNFWATWCVPCRQELPALQQFAAEQHGR